MEKTSQSIGKTSSKMGATSDGDILFESGLYCQDAYPDECKLEEMTFNRVMQSVNSVYSPSVFVGTVGVWTGRRPGYRYCRDFNEFRGVLSKYDDITIRQIGTRLHFALRHHDGHHEMELRCLTERGYSHLDDVGLDYFDEETLKFINRHTRTFGKLPAIFR